ncbi:hypothetical protein PLIIFM63780_006994 [Purpureocillium lilacinum]|uniref:uncharacterized protein n=1 Tax=Purpureocillium lilacinum TaxID=33203 RepID=UPI0020823E66|nr:hypothetical protein PLICBS_007003 [Purpureocillium lilacinum]GJN83445.1 hypothetical protein PLIIFM63780_006994 [Purpureocillium lilacinum]
MKSGEDRDSIAARDGIVAFEMEGAGVWDEMPSVVVKGVCDYADCHKHKRWQDFAAAAAASAMKGLLNLWLYRDDAPQPASSSNDDEVTLSSIREELEWVPMPAPARGSREDYEGPANSSWADRMIFSPDTSFGEGLRVNFGDLDRSLDEANAQLRSLLEMTRPINPRAPLTRESSSSTLRPHGFADDSRLSDSTLRPFSQSLETPPSFNTWNDFLTGQGHGTAPRTAMYIPGLTEVNFVPPPLPPPRQLPFTRLSTETDNAQLDRQAVIHDKATDHDENYHPASGSPVRGGTAYHASSMANEMLKGEIEDGAGEALWLQHGRFFPSTADAHTRHTLERLNSNQEEVQAVEGIRRLG